MKKRVCSVFLIIVMLLSCYGTSAVAVDRFTAAFDLNADGYVNSSDARLLLQCSAGLIRLQATQAAKNINIKVFGDCNGDEKVNSSDARVMLRYAARLIGQSDFVIITETPTTEGEELVDNPTDPVIDPTVVIPPETLPQYETVGIDPEALPKNSLLSPTVNHGLGKAKMIITKVDHAEMTPAGVQNLKSYPLMNPYIKGTVDYVSKMATYYGEDTYLLTSGAKIETEDATYLAEGYVLPDNVLSLAGVRTSTDETEIYLKTTWQVPMCVQFKPQTYYEGYEGRAYNLKSFTAEYMEIQFSYTTSGSGTFSFPSHSVFRSASWSTSAVTKVTTLKLFFSETGKFSGYDLSITDNGYIRIMAKNQQPVLTGKTVVLDPGHGGNDPGGGSMGVYEDRINLNTALYLKEMLELSGANVIMTRTDDTTVSLDRRAEITRNVNADLFLSIHCDVANSASAAGVSVYYYYPFSMPYAKCLQNGLVQAYQTAVYAPTDANYSKVDRDIKFYPFFVTRNEICPTVLIELGFLTNADERQTLQTEKTQRALAQGIYNGIVDYLNR